MLIKNFFYRTYQFIETMMIRIKPIKPRGLVSGINSVNKIGEIIKNKNISSTLIVTTKGMVDRGTINPLCKSLDSNNIKYKIYSAVEPDPSIDLVEMAVKMYKENGLKSIIAFGGGSCMDLAKILGARIVKPNKLVTELSGIFKIRKELPFFIAVPTTCGTGSEVTAAAVITDKSCNPARKFTIMDYRIVPDVAVLDASLLKTLPSNIIAQTAMDAFTHAMESYTNKFSSKKMQKYAIKAMMLINENLVDVIEENSDSDSDVALEKKQNLLKASYYAGISFTNAFVGYVHSVAHAIGAIYHLPHGLCCAVLLPNIMDKYGASVEVKMSKIAKSLNINLKPNQSYLYAVTDYLRNLNSKIGIPNSFERLDSRDFDIISQRAVKEANPSYPVPKILSYSDIRNVLERVY